jgi:hypothetical protein
MERWQNKLGELSTHKCVRITKAIRLIGSELCDSTQFDGIGLVEAFLVKMEKVILVEWRIQAMDALVQRTPTLWWVTHHANIQD